MTPEAWAFLLGAVAGIVAVHVAAAVLMALIVRDEDHVVKKKDAGRVE